VQRDRLYQKGLIVPRIKADDQGAADKFAPEDLDDFLARLLAGAAPVDVAAAGQVNIPEAAKLAFVMSEDVVRLVLDGKLTRKSRLTSERGYMSLLLDIEEVRAGPGPGARRSHRPRNQGKAFDDREGRRRAHKARLPRDGHRHQPREPLPSHRRAGG
jgi:hypothetical protein